MQQLSIGAVAQLTQIPAHTLRKWESRHGIAVPIRSDTGRRIYTQAHVEQLQLIKTLVGRGHALAHLAELNTEELRQLAGLHEQPQPQVQISSLSLVGPNVCWLLSGSGLVQHRYPGDLQGWQTHSGFGDVDGLVVECDTLPPDAVEALLHIKTDLQLVVVVYKYAARRTVAQLQDHGVVTLNGPVSDDDILAHLQVREDQPFTPAPQRFSNAELGRIAAMSPGLQCECPNHIAKLLMDITSFEHYSNECVDTDPAERALHQKLGEISSQARALFEDALVAVATADGIQLNPN